MRTVERFTHVGWKVVTMSDLNPGDIFRLWESTGEQVVDARDGRTQWIATSQPFIATEHGVWSIECE